MSAQSAKKKRFGSRRRVVNQNEISKADEFHVADSTLVAERHIPEEHTESLNVLAHLDNSQSDTQHPASPELSGSRRKLGSSRRNKGRHVKDSATELYHEHREEVEDRTREKETTITKQTPHAIQSERQEALSQHDGFLYSASTPVFASEAQNATTINDPEANLESLIPKDGNLQTDLDENETNFEEISDTFKLVETTQEGTDKSILHSAEVGISELTSLSALSCPTVDLQLIDQSNFKEMPEQKLPNVSSVTEKEDKKRDTTELFRQGGNLESNCLVGESHVESVAMPFSTMLEATTEKISSAENTEVECSVGQTTVSSPGNVLPTDEEQNEHFNLSEVREAHHSEDAVNTQECRPTEMPQTDNSSESVIHDATGNSEIISGNLTVQTEVSDTNQSEKSPDGSPINQDISNPDNKQDEHHADENNVEALEQQQNDTSFNPIASRRKLGSSRRNRGRQHVKDSGDESKQEHEEDVESTRGNEAFKTAQMLLAIERTSQEELSQGSEHDIKPATHDSSLYSATMTDYSSEVQSPTTTNYPEADLEGLVPESENLQEDHDERETHFKVEESDESVGATLEGSDKSDALQSQEVKGEHHSEDAVNKEHEQEVKTTENQEMPQIDNSSESVIHEATENSEIISRNLTDQTEVSDTNQSEESPDGSPINQDISNPDNKQDEHHTDENNVEALEKKNEDGHVYDTKEPQISDIETVDTALGQVHETEGRVEDDIKPSAEQTAHQEKERLLSEEEESESSLQTLQSEVKASLDSQLQQNDTSFNPIGSRRKLGSSRRNRGRQHVKDSADESHQEQKDDVESTRGNEAYKTAQMLLATERTSQEDLSQGSEHDIKPATHDSSLYSATMTDYSPEVQSPTTTNYPEADLESLVPESENLPEDHDEREIHFKVEESDESVGATLEGSDKSDALQSQEVKGEHHSEDAVNKEHEQEVKTTENQEMPQIDNSSESVIREATENSEIISGNLTDQTEVSDTNQSELTEESPDGSPINQDISNPDNKQDEHHTDENNVEALEQKNEDDHVYDTKEPQISDLETVDTALGQVHETEGRVVDDIKPSAEQTAHQEKERLLSEEEESESSLQTLQSEIKASLDSQLQQVDTSFNPIGSRRKLGSSRRNRGRQHVKDSADELKQEQKDDVESTRGNEAFKTAQMLLATERTSQEELHQGSEHDIKPATHDSSLYSATMTDYSPEVQSPTTTNYPEADLESLVPESENLLENHDEREIHFKVEESDESVGAALEGSDKSDALQSQEVKGEHHSEDAVNKEHEQEVKTTENQEMPQIDNSSESVIHDATENSEIISGNLTDQTEVSDTKQSEESPDGSPINQDISNPDNKQDEHRTDENNVEALEKKNEDDHVYDTKEPQISDIETVDTAPGQVHETEGRVEDDIKPSAEQTAHQEKERLFSEEEESESSLQTLQSEIKASLDSQLQQNDTSFNPIGSRRKLGSSRRNRGRRHVKDSADESKQEHEEDVESTRGNEAFKTAQMLLATERTSQEELHQGSEHDIKPATHDSSLFSDTMTDYSSEVQSPTTTNYPEADPEGLVPESENLQEDHDERETHFKVEESDESVGATLEGSDKSDALQSQEVKGEHHSEDALNKEHEQEVKTTENQEMPQIDNSSESVIREATENSEIISGNLTDQTEVSDTNQSELTEESPDGSPINQDISNPDNKQDEHHTDENNVEALEKKNEDDHVYDTKEPQISDIETVDTALGQVHETEGRVEDDIKPSAEQTAHQEKERLFSEEEESESSLQTLQSEIKASLDFQLQQNDTSFNPIGSRRKLGSSRRNRGRRHVKDSADESKQEHEEDVESTRGNEPLETTEMSSIETVVQEKLMETMLEGMDTFDTPQTRDVKDNIGTQEMDEDTQSLRQDGNLQTNYLVSESHAKSEDIEPSISLEVSSENSPGEHTEVECSVEQAAMSSSTEELSTNEEQKEYVSLGASEDSINKVHEEVIQPTQMQEMPQIDNPSIEDSESSSQTLQSENVDFQHLDDSIKEQTQTSFSSRGNRRKLGSSRRRKGQLHVEDTTSLVMETMRQEELKEQTNPDSKFAGEIGSTVNNDPDKMSKEDTILSQNLIDNCTIVTTDITSSSGKDDLIKEVNEEECKVTKETENLSQLESDTDKMDLIPSPEVSSTARFIASDVLEQEEAFQVHNIALYDKEVNMQQTNETPETVGDVMKQVYITEAESSINAQVYKPDEDGEQFEDPTKKDHEAHEMDVSPEITQQFSAAHNKTESLAPFDVGLKEDIQTESAVDVSEESQQGTQEQINSDDGENLQGRSQQKRRKLGSTRRTLLKKKIEEKRVETKDLNTEVDTRSLDKMEVVEELTMTVTAEVSQNKPPLSPLDKEQQESISKALLPEQSASHNKELIQPMIKLGNAIESVQRENEKRPEVMTQDPAVKSAEAPVVADLEIEESAVRGGAAEEQTSSQASEQEPDDMNEEVHNKHLKMKNASPNLDSTSRRRKMGSSRRRLGQQTKQEDLHQKQEVDDEATGTETNVGDVKKESFSGIVEDELQLHTEHKDSEQREEKGSETMAHSHTDEVNPVSHGQLEETELRLTPTYLPSTPSTSPKHDSVSPGGRRRKMGSHRKSRGRQNHENQTARGDKLTDDERDVRSITDGSAIKTTETSLGLDKISEVNKGKEGDLWRPVSGKTPGPVTPGQHPYAEIKLGQESEHKFSLAGDSRSRAYNVTMIGDSCVGKTSFMKRAHSGKFSLDLPASVGLDSCMWTVIVDGKPVVLQLWDTAGQERFHSITRQIFHKAHAFLLMYDITSSKSFSAVSYWASCIQEGAAEDVTILLVGNKSDHAERQVNTQEAEVLAKEYNFEFMECSAATGENVVQCLETVARMLSEKVDTREEAMVLHKEPKQRKSGCC